MSQWDRFPDSFILENHILIAADIWERYQQGKLKRMYRDIERKELAERLEAIRRKALPAPVAEVDIRPKPEEMHGLYVELAETLEIPLEESICGRRKRRRRA